MTATDSQHHLADQAAQCATYPRPRLLHLRASSRLILAALAMPDGSVKLIRAATADHPELDALAEMERSRVRSAILSLAQRGEASDAVA